MFDTRPQYLVGDRKTPMTEGETWTVQVTGSHGNCKNIPTEAKAVAMNVTADFPSELTYITVWPAGEPLPNASALNPTPGKPSPNEVNSRLGKDGKLSFYNTKGTVNVLADISGYYVDHNHDDRYYTKSQVDARAPQETVISVSSADFNPLDAGSVVGRSETDGGAWQAAGTAQPGLIAGVQIPNGGVITGVKAEYWDNSTENLTIALRCEGMAGFTDLYSADTSTQAAAWASLDLAAVGGGTTPSSTSSTTSTTAAPVGPKVDNTTCGYQVYVTNANWSTETDALRIKAVHITVKTSS